MTALTLGSSAHTISLLSTKNITTLNKNNISNNEQKLFNNSYEVLGNNSSIITNQSTSDNQYYSYDLSYLPDKLSNGFDPKNLFTVDNQGALQYKSDAANHIPPGDKSMVDNVKTKIEENKTVTKIKNPNNFYSKSIYDIEYFTGSNSNWQYLQLGGGEKHINISSQSNANKVDNYQNLSESFGLYYIAKAVINKNIDQAVANKLAKWFINNSSLKSSLDDSLVEKIISLIIHNSSIYDFIYNMPCTNNDKNYSLNFVFDIKNNLIEIYYNKWKNDSYTKNINYQYNDSFNGSSSQNGYLNKTIIIFDNWVDYANNWYDFCQVFSSLTFDDNSFISATTVDGEDKKENIILSTDALTSQVETKVQAYSHDHVFLFWAVLTVALNMWHDDHNIYLNTKITESASGGTESLFSKINLNQVIFNSAMK